MLMYELVWRSGGLLEVSYIHFPPNVNSRIPGWTCSGEDRIDLTGSKELASQK